MVRNEEVESPIIVEISPQRISPGPGQIAVQPSLNRDVGKLLRQGRG